MEYVTNFQNKVRGRKIDSEGRTYTSYEFFDAPNIFEPHISVDDKATKGIWDFPQWKREVKCKDWRNVVNSSKFTKFRKKRPFPYKEQDPLYVWWYDANYHIKNGQIYVDLIGVTREGGMTNISVKNFKPYMYVGVPDNWIRKLEEAGLGEDEINSRLNDMVYVLRNNLEETLHRMLAKNSQFRGLPYYVCPIDTTVNHIEEINDVLGYNANKKTKAFRLEVSQPKLIPKVRELLWNPLGGKGAYNTPIPAWYNKEILLLPDECHILARDDREWIEEKRREVEASGREFNMHEYEYHEDRFLYRLFFKRGQFGSDPRFTCYECNVDFTVRYLTDQKKHVGWVKLENWKMVDTHNKRTTADVEVIVDKNDIHQLSDRSVSSNINDNGKNSIEMTADEEVSMELYKQKPPVSFMSFDAEMLSVWPNFPNPRFCPIIAWGCRVIDNATNEDRRFYFLLAPCPPEKYEYREEFSYRNQKTAYKVDEGENVFFYYRYEVDLIRDLLEFYAVMRSNIIMGWNIRGFDIIYLVLRCIFLNIPEGKNFLQINPYSTTSWRDTFVKGKKHVDVNVFGTFILDLYLYTQTNCNFNSYSLNFVSMAVLGQRKVDLSYAFIESSQFTSYETQSNIVKYLQGDIDLPYQIFTKMNMFITVIEFSIMQNCTCNQLVLSGAQLKAFASILGYLSELQDSTGYRHLLPTHARKSKEEYTEKYAGAHVFTPESAFYIDYLIATLDFASLYPSIMMDENLCYCTFLDAKTRKDNKLVEGRDYKKFGNFKMNENRRLEYYPNAHGIEIVTKNVREGFIPIMQKERKKRRSAVKWEMAKAEDECELLNIQLENMKTKINSNTVSMQEKTELEKSIIAMNIKIGNIREKIKRLNSRQLALKLTMNCLYGFMGATDSLAPLIMIAKQICKRGQEAILQTQEYMEQTCTIKNGFPGNAWVIYGDTDSIMFLLKDWVKKQNLPEFMALAVYFAERVTKEKFNYGLIQEFEKVFENMNMIRKKKYLAMRKEISGNSSIARAGVSSVRRDCPAIINLLDEIVVESVVIMEDVKTALEYVKLALDALDEGTISLRDLFVQAPLKDNLSDALKPNKNGKLVMTPGKIMAVKEKERTGKEGSAGDRYPYVVREDMSFTQVKTRMEKTSAQIESPLYLLQNGIRYNATYYKERVYKNMVSLMNYMVPHQEDELKHMWLKYHGEKKKVTKRARDGTELTKCGGNKVNTRCCICRRSVYSAKELFLQETNRIQQTHKKKVIVHFEQSGQPDDSYDSDGVKNMDTSSDEHLQKEYTIISNNSQLMCHSCKISFSNKLITKRKFEIAFKQVIHTWNTCQTCCARTMGHDVVVNCTNYECSNFFPRTEAANKMHTEWQKLILMEW